MTRLARRNVVGVVAIVTVAAAVVFGLVLLGSRSEERSRRLDERRIEDLGRLARSIAQHWTRTGRLAASLSVLSEAPLPGPSSSDPATGQPYGYRALTGSTFELCGFFETDRSQPFQEEFWSHPAGRYCFALDVRDVRREHQQLPR